MTFYIAEPLAGTNNPVLLNGDDQYFLPAGVSVYGTNIGLRVLNGNNTIMIEGTLTGEFGLEIGDGTDLSGANSVTIAKTGVLTGRTLDAIDVYNINTTIVNYGVVLGAYNGINVTPNAIGTTITNYGRILAANVPVYASQSVVLKNFGTITGYNELNAAGSFSFVGSGQTDRVVNRGTMNGVVSMAGGADQYDGAGGRVSISVNGGFGNDVLRGGAVSDRMYGDDNNDILDGRGARDRLAGGSGNDTFDYNAISDSSPTAATRDYIEDFNRFGDDRIDLSTIDANTSVAGNQAFSLLLKGTATSAVGAGKIGWYWIDNANNALDRTIIRINNDADASIEMQIELFGLKSLSNLAGVDFVF